MIIALLSALAFAPAGDPEVWTPLPPDPDGLMAYRRLTAEPGDSGPRFLLRVTLHHPWEWTTGEMTHVIDCAARNVTLVGVRSLDGEDRELQSVTVPEDRRRAEPVYSGDQGYSLIYADLCPEGPPLDEPPPPLPPPVAVGLSDDGAA